jgi:DNA-binding IclR family transcriptional regulator
MSNGEGASGAPVQSVDRALVILNVLAQTGEAGVTELATSLEVHKSTAFRLVATLESHGLVEQTEDRGKYRLGVGLLRLASATTARLDVVQVARPVCRALAATTGETINVAVLVDGAALYLDQVAGQSALQPHNWVGQRIPLHATANGKVLLSGVEPDELETLVGPLSAYTDRTTTSMARLWREIDAVRQQGYAVAVDEFEVGLTAVAAPVRDAHGEVVASLSVSGPSFRLGAARIEEVFPHVTAASANVSQRLGLGQTSR